VGTLLIEEAEPGLRVTSPVINEKGQLLLPAGTVLSDRHLRLLKSWGVGSVEIEGPTDDAPDGQDLAPLQPMEEERFLRVFSGVLEDPLMKEIYAVIQSHMASRLEGKSGTG
jgi:hypothetical protein